MSGCMERIAMTIRDGGAGAGARHEGHHEPRGQPHFVLPPNLYMGPPVGGTFWFQIFIQAPSPEIWSETISGGEEVLAGKWGSLFLAYLLGKNFRRRDRDHLVPPGGWTQQSAVPRCAILSVGSTGGIGSETPRVHNVARWCGGVAGRGARDRAVRS